MKRPLGMLVGLIFIGCLFPCELFAKEGDTDKGRALYMKHCQICHGPEGKGDGYTKFNPPVADLTVSAIQQKSDQELWKSIHMGVANSAMGMWRFVLSDEEISLVLRYVRSFAR